MNHELLFIIVALLSLLFVLIAFRLGRVYLFAVVIGYIMFVNMVSSKIVTVAGLDGTVANVFYAAIFLATDMLSEHYGKEYAYKSVRLGFLGLMIIIIFGPLVNLFQATSYSSAEGDALRVIFGRTARIAVASLIAYLISNFFDVWWYDKIQTRFPAKKHLYVRNIGSTVVSQLIDNTAFVLMAFAGDVPGDALWQIWLAGYGVKVTVALLDTPFMYLSYVIKPKTLTSGAA